MTVPIPLSVLPGIGPKSAKLLERAGITTIEQLRKIGHLAAYELVKKAEPKVSPKLLSVLEGALSDRRWREVAREHRAGLSLILEPVEISVVNTQTDLPRLVQSFRQCVGLAGIVLSPDALTLEVLDAPHKAPRKVPSGKLAVYLFFHGGKCLKIGKAGGNSHTRYSSQHYNAGGSSSNLAKSLVDARQEMGIDHVLAREVGKWIRENVSRVNVLLDARYGVVVQNLLESFLQCALNPRFEGRESQRAR